MEYAEAVIYLTKYVLDISMLTTHTHTHTHTSAIRLAIRICLLNRTKSIHFAKLEAIVIRQNVPHSLHKNRGVRAPAAPPSGHMLYYGVLELGNI